MKEHDGRMATTELRCFHNDCDWVIAIDHDDLRDIMREHLGDTEADFSRDNDLGERDDWQELAPTSPLTITDRDGEHSPPGTKETKTIAEWIAAKGRGFLCSTEY